MATIKREKVHPAVESFKRLMRVARRPSGVRQKRMHEIIEEGVVLLEAHNSRKHAVQDIALLNYLLGIAIGVGAISEQQCARLITMITDETSAKKKTGR